MGCGGSKPEDKAADEDADVVLGIAPLPKGHRLLAELAAALDKQTLVEDGAVQHFLDGVVSTPAFVDELEAQSTSADAFVTWVHQVEHAIASKAASCAFLRRTWKVDTPPPTANPPPGGMTFTQLAPDPPAAPYREPRL